MSINYLNFAVEFVKTLALVNFAILKSFFRFFIPKKFLMKSVDGKVVLITGAGSGIGAALAMKFAKRHSHLVLLDINEKGLENTKKMCLECQVDANISTFVIDVTDRKKIMDLSKKIKPVDILINNAGVVSGKSINELDEQSILKTFNVNVISHFWTTQAFLPSMLENNSGQIVSIASMAGLIGINKLTDYCASKFAAVGFQESLMNEIQTANKLGVHCLTVCPYYVNTGLFKGVKLCSPLAQMLELDNVATKIEEAILMNSTILYIPGSSYLSLVFKILLPVEGFNYIDNIYGTNHSMETFTGRE